MTRFAVALASALLTGSLFFGGCLPSSRVVNEQEDSNYLNGRARVSSLDYKGAIEEFEKAIANNPNSSSAHLELALLHEEQLNDYAAAIYHYEKHLKLRPKSEYAERARERIKSCKMDLVKTEVLGPVNQGMQRELERLANENTLLRQRIETLELQLTTAQQAPVAQVAPATRQVTATPVRTQQPVVQNAPATARDPGVRPTANVQVVSPPSSAREPQTAKPRVHIVKSGDKLTTIAQSYGVNLNRLMQANPGVSATRLQIGQSIKIP